MTQLTSLKDFIKVNGFKQSFKTGELFPVRDKTGFNIFLIDIGEARVIFKDRNRRTTLKKIGPNNFIGLASSVVGINCEEVRASSPTEVYKIDHKSIIEFIEKTKPLKDLLSSYLFDEEVAFIIESLLTDNKTQKISFKNIFNNLKGFAKILNTESNIINSLERDDYVFVYNLNSKNELINRIESKNIFSKIKGQLFKDNKRIISFSKKEFSNYKEFFEINNIKSIDLKQIKKSNTFSSIFDSSEDLISNNEEIIENNLELFKLLSEILNIPFRRDSIERVLRDSFKNSESPSIEMIGKLSSSLGLHAASAKIPADFITRIEIPAFIRFEKSFALISESDNESIKISTSFDNSIKLTKKEISKSFPSEVEVVLLEKSNLTKTKKFTLQWFLPVLRKYKNILFQVLLASFVIQLFTLSSPLIIQLIIDKVINQRSLDTLQVLGIALVFVTLLEGVLGSLKTFLFTDTTNRIDQRLGAEVIDHLLRLPLNYFDKRPVGELSSRISELEKIRNFLTGQAMSSILDAFFSIIYIVVMFFYSSLLTLVALAVIPIQIGLTLIGAPLFRRQYRRTAEENAKTQSHLVEILSGVQTVKAQNAEIVSRWKWQDLYSKYISRTFEQTITGTVVVQLSQVLQKISQLLVLWVGARLVLDGYLSLGQLIAFRIISGYVTQPVLRLSSIWQNIQELKISFERLSDVIDTPQESDETDKDKIPLSKVNGKVEFENVTFSFTKTGPKIIKNLNLKIKEGQFVGIVGESGSGKSTLMKLLPRLYCPDKGRILIDDTDIDKVELYSLRRQIGVVPQEPLLFSGSISHNIALTNPDASSEEIVRAAKIADAHDFIMRLPDGYSTSIGERATTLSGGQRQRIAIARTILGLPKLLIMDEATSALDYKTEKTVCDNLAKSLKQNTVFFITHRLATIKDADLIILMDNGSIIESGSHTQLMEKEGKYFDLYSQQEN